MTENLSEYFKQDELRASVWLSKYAQKDEITPDDMHRRMAKEFARIEENYQKKESSFKEGLSDYGLHRNSLNEQSIYELFKDFKYIIPQGSVMSQLGSDSIGSLSNCFVIGTPADSYGGIFQKDEEMAHLMKRRGGVGIDISTLRPDGTFVSNAAKTSTGAVSFMHRYSNTTREVAQSGRRGALMISISINHPDVMEFIKIKRDLTQVTGANISIKLNNEFMKAVENDEDYILRFPCDLNESLIKQYSIENYEYNKLEKINRGYIKRIKAKEYWDEIIKSAHNVAEPGLMFEDNHINYSPDGVYEQYRGITTNPCGEIFMQPYDACRLIAVNLISFVDNPFTKEASFNFKKFYEYNYEAMRLSDDLVDLELEYIERIINKIKNDPEEEDVKQRELVLWQKVYSTAKSSRRTGLGVTALGDCLAALGIKYDSNDALSMIDSIFYFKIKSELDCTIDLSILRGAFEGWDWQKEFEVTKGKNDFYQMLQNYFPEQVGRMCDYGRRNVSWNTVAPTGTVSLMANNCTGGIEPLFSPYYFRRKKVNPGEQGVRVDFVDQNGDSWTEYPVLHPYFKEWISTKTDYIEQVEANIISSVEELNKATLKSLFTDSPWYGSTANDIDWVKRVEIQGIIQKYITHSISSTINLPSDVSEEEVSRIYMESWKRGLKGITVYRDGSRSGVLITEPKKENTEFSYKDAPKRPKSLPCDIHHVKSKGKDFTVLIGLFNDNPYEVFALEGKLAVHFEKGTLIKKSQGKYDLITSEEIDNNTAEVHVDTNIASEMSPEQSALTRLISTALRHGANIKFISEQLNKSHGDITSFNKAIARALKKYIKDEKVHGEKCDNCGQETIIYKEGCKSCTSCGHSKCG